MPPYKGKLNSRISKGSFVTFSLMIKILGAAVAERYE